MVVILNEASVIAFFATLIFLGIASIYDLRERRVPNRITLFFGASGIAIGILTGHIINEWMLHLFALTTLLLAYVLYRNGVLGGADLKTLLVISIISPGLEFTVWEWPYFETFISGTLQILIMLLLGVIWSRRGNEEEDRKTPLIPLLLMGYLIVQLLALI
jgi:Flp pilus assembly protein protease CpaA